MLLLLLLPLVLLSAPRYYMAVCGILCSLL
jgi:hypothetical protein